MVVADGYVLTNICPTRVGMNRRNLTNYTADNGHLPHTRGDEPVYDLTDGSSVDQSAPHAWG